MKLETFFEKFDQFADAPGAVEKMRELVLRMATSGRIAEQNPADQPGSELLEEIFAVRDSLIKRGTAKNRVEGNPITAGDTIDLPSSWARCMISEVCDLQTGATPSRAEHSYFGGDTPWLVSGDINKGEITECDGRITKEGLENSNCKIIPVNSVLIALNGQGKTRATVAVLRIPAALNQSLVAMIPYSGERLLPEYIFWNLRGRYYAIRDITGQDQRRGLNMKLVGQLSLPIPPLAEQKRIVAKVDELMALCDRLETQQQERETRHAALARASLTRFADAPTPANLQFLFHKSYTIPPADLRKSILTLAVQGKLVPQDPNDEPAEELFEKIQTERAQQEATGAYKSAKSLPPIGESEVPFKLPVEWKWARLRSLVFTLGDGLHGTPEYSDGTDCYFINGNNLVDGRIVIKPHTKTVSLDEARKHRKPMTLSTVLVSINGTLGSVAFYNNENVILGKSACYFNLASLVDKQFVRRVIESPYFINYASDNATGTTIRNLGLKAMNHFPIPLPPLAEQRRIVAKVDQLMALVDALETQLATSRATAENLLNAVITELTKSSQSDRNPARGRKLNKPNLKLLS
ncbi:MAG: restriction endonuclease subunit S [Candidatus Sumerlaeaceae bacterium]|nr:restriction endonuclease subunit S [Candidatus Sumerlaeaceae bacterium]